MVEGLELFGGGGVPSKNTIEQRGAKTKFPNERASAAVPCDTDEKCNVCDKDSFCVATVSADVTLFGRFPVLSHFCELRHVIFKKLFHLLPIIRFDQIMSQKMHKDLNFANL